jgi:hypothetical protein
MSICCSTWDKYPSLSSFTTTKKQKKIMMTSKLACHHFLSLKKLRWWAIALFIVITYTYVRASKQRQASSSFTIGKKTKNGWWKVVQLFVMVFSLGKELDQQWVTLLLIMVNYVWIKVYVVTLVLGLWPRQGLARVRDKREAWEWHFILLGV